MVINYTILQQIKKTIVTKKRVLSQYRSLSRKTKENRIDRVFAGHNRMSRGCRLEPVHTCTYLTLRQAVTYLYSTDQNQPNRK